MGTSLKVRCVSPGYSASRMWTAGKEYPAQMSGPLAGNLVVVDDLGRERVMGNESNPRFPMGTDGNWLFPTTYTALFERIEVEEAHEADG